jgi:hypothetical protein
LNVHDFVQAAKRRGYTAAELPLFPPRAFPSFSEHEQPKAS